MRLKKNLFLCICLIFLNNCVESTAFLGPAVTAGATGNVYQAGFSYGSNYAIEKTTGKTAGEHFANFLESKKFKDKRTKLINTKENIKELFINFEKNSSEFYTSVKNFYFKEKID